MHKPRTTASRSGARALLAVGVAFLALVTGVLVPTTAGAVPADAGAAAAQVRDAADRLSAIDEQVRQAEATVAAQQQAAATAAAQAVAAHAAVAAYDPQLRAIAQSGYTAKTQSRFAAFLTSRSATELVEQMTTLDVIAAHTNSVIAQVAAAQNAAVKAQAAADRAAATAQAGLAQLKAQQAEVRNQVGAYQTEFSRLSAAEQTAVTTAVAGQALPTPRNLPMPPGAAGKAIAVALAQVGRPYESGAAGPDAFDCSGLTMFAYGAAGIALAHSSREQSTLGTQVTRAELKPGDLVFFYTPISHVALYIGDGMIVHARTFGSPVAVTSVDMRGFRFGVRLG